MPTPVQTAPITLLRQQLKTIIRNAFTTGELVEVRDGRMHAALQGPRAAVSPLSEAEGRLVLDQDSTVVIQVFLPWPERVDPNITIDPTTLEAYAETLREAIYSATHPYAGSAGLWDLRVLQTQYQTDPVGQITRFEMLVQGIGQNFAETTA